MKPDERPTVEYRSPAQEGHPDRWQLGRLTEIAGALCLTVALGLAGMTYVVAHSHSRPYTPAYNKHLQQIRAIIATRPSTTSPSMLPSFTGQVYVSRPYFSIPLSWFAVLFFVAAVAIFVVRFRVQ